MSDALLFSLLMAMIMTMNFRSLWEVFICIRAVQSSFNATDATDADAVKAVLPGQY